MTNNVRPIPEGYHSVTPAITCKNAGSAIDFYKKAFGAQEVMRMSGPNGAVMHAEIKIGDSIIFIGDEWPGMSSAPNPQATPSSYLYIYSDNVDKLFNQAVAAGCKSAMPLTNQFWGDRYGKVSDPFGHHWGLSQHVEDVPHEEMERRSKEWMATMAKSATQ